jgi:uncharacterized membrane protein YciS (DUF1049 family)
MLQLIIAVLATIVIVALGMSNLHPVHVSCVFGAPYQVRLSVLIAVTFIAGFMTAVFRQMIRRAQLDARRRKALLKQRTRALAKMESV